MCVRCSIKHIYWAKDIDLFHLLLNGWGCSVMFKNHNTVLRMKYLQRRHRYQFTKLNKYFVFKLADMFILDYKNQTDVFEMINLCC